jgi:hypothetical protein
MFSSLIELFTTQNIKRKVCPLHVLSQNRRTIASINIKDSMFKTDEGCRGQCEMDTHADTCVAGGNFMACGFDGTTCEVTPFTDAYESMKDIPIVTAATAWTNEETVQQVKH